MFNIFSLIIYTLFFFSHRFHIFLYLCYWIDIILIFLSLFLSLSISLSYFLPNQISRFFSLFLRFFSISPSNILSNQFHRFSIQYINIFYYSHLISLQDLIWRLTLIWIVCFSDYLFIYLLILVFFLNFF